MVFGTPTAASRALQLRQSYLCISKYIRSRKYLGHSTYSVTGTISTRCSSTSVKETLQDSKSKLVENAAGSTLVKPQNISKHHALVLTSHVPELDTSQYKSLVNFERTSIHESTSLTTWHDLAALAPDNIDVQTRSHEIKICGYVTSQRQGKGFTFLQLVDPSLKYSVQVIVKDDKKPVELPSSGQPLTSSSTIDPPEQGTEDIYNQLRYVRPHTPVQIQGILVPRKPPRAKKADLKHVRDNVDQNGTGEPVHTVATHDPFVGDVNLVARLEIQAETLNPLNTFPPDVIAQVDTAFPPEGRHLQFRTDPALRRRIQLRTQVATRVRQHLVSSGFEEIETPILFKSTPEGAREFIVPTRKKGLAYALPQSPQQYKQLLMASGISRYFQFARCFRDEDLRADRQPEFTQLDLEMSFADSQAVMDTIRTLLVNSILPTACPDLHVDKTFATYQYQDVMESYGSDKPDIRLGSKIKRIDGWFPPNVVGMMTSLKDPAVEMIKINMQGTSPAESGEFIRSFMDLPTSAIYANNSEGMPGIAVYDVRKPMSGLASFEHDAALKIEQVFQPEPGDILIAQTRANSRLTGGSTTLGGLRRDVYAAAIERGILSPPEGISIIWVVDFPLFSPIEDSAPGQGGSAGICSTHHPFTAPKPGQDLSKLITNPIDIIGDHYDLVINGVEVGGGSRRIHTSDMQELIFKDVLKMKPERIEDFRHLLGALSSGCPPHAGFALGFDRLMAVLTGRNSVRDVIAFPKTADGEDKFVGSPTWLNEDQLKTYHLKITDTMSMTPSPAVSVKA
ncbi:aspartate-tRNA ligase [Exophiala mesophila]|uniref:Aspartate-tRNA ligase n=1 Tax=Exophiala mesophila TaxID=212818 RepID=A0A0D1WY39_EXOME|nr:aspartate-tRNA ligase [Exophiala mesophila]KIV94380.1 aspartate-tRNA ligase [Exophiala mesophila]